MENKTCKTCGVEKHVLTHFSKHGFYNGKQYFKAHCNECRKKKRKTKKIEYKKPEHFKCKACCETKIYNEENFKIEKRNKSGLTSKCAICISKEAAIYNEKQKSSKKVARQTKKCTGCNIAKQATATFFHRSSRAKDGLKSECKECNCARTREWNKRPETKEREREKFQKSAFHRIKRSVNCSINHGLKRESSHKDGSCWDYLGYTVHELKEHLEKHFEDWMSWENYGTIAKYDKGRTWQIDHIYPHSLLPYDSMDCANFKKCWSLENLRPLDSKQNIKKSNKILE
jgi:hypothetical protein